MKKETHFHVRTDHDFRNKYMDFCKKNRYIFAKRIRVLIEKDMNGEIK